MQVAAHADHDPIGEKQRFRNREIESALLTRGQLLRCLLDKIECQLPHVSPRAGFPSDPSAQAVEYSQLPRSPFGIRCNDLRVLGIDGRGNLLGQAHKLHELGAKARRALPARVDDGDDEEEGEDRGPDA